MSTYIKVKKDLEIAKLIGNIAQVYEYIYISKVQKVRTRVLGSRQFVEGLSDIYNEVRIAFKTQVESVIKRRNNSILSKFLASRRKKQRKLPSEGPITYLPPDQWKFEYDLETGFKDLDDECVF